MGLGVSDENLGVAYRIVHCLKALPSKLPLAFQLTITSSVLPGLLVTLCYTMHVSEPLLSETRAINEGDMHGYI